MELKIVRKDLESEKLPFNTEMILRSLSNRIKTVSSVGIEFGTGKDDMKYHRIYEVNALCLENLAILSLYKKCNVIDLASNEDRLYNLFQTASDNSKPSMSLLDYIVTLDPECDHIPRLGSIQIPIGFVSPSSMNKGAILYYIDDSEIYIPNIIMLGNFNIQYCIYLANKFINNPVIDLTKCQIDLD